jgi:hypothetical protein
MSVVKELPPRSYTNVMEVLVAEEVDRQLAQLPPRVLKYVKRLEVETYALNRLPPLYASSEKGWKCQYERAARTMHKQIADAVRQSIAAVQVDPIRSSQPLPLITGQGSEAVLAKLRKASGQPDLTWERILRRLRKKTESSTTAAAATAQNYPVWRPGTYGESTWRPKKQRPTGDVSISSASSGRSYDWEDSQYNR